MPNKPQTIIVERQSNQKILLDLLSKQSSIGDTSFVSLNVFLNTLVESHPDEDWFKCALALENLSQDEHITIFKDILHFPITSDQVISFLNTMAEEGWKLEDLPDIDAKTHELKYVLGHLSQSLNIKARQWQKVSELDDLSNITVHDHFHSYPVNKRLIDLKSKGLILESLPKKESIIAVRFTNNPRSEAQACVQMLLTDSMAYEDQAIVCLDPNIQDQLESFLIQYEIPYSRLSDAHNHPSFGLIQALIKLSVDPNHENLMALIHNDCLHLRNKLALVQYLDTFKLDLDDCLLPFTQVQNQSSNSHLKEMIRLDAFIQLEKDAEIGIQGLRENLKTLSALDIRDVSSTLGSIFDLYVSLHTSLDDETIQCIQKVKALIEAGHESLIQMIDPIPALLYKLSKLTLSSKVRSGVLVTDLKQAFIPGLKRMFWLGCTQNNYPQFESHTGLFDEDYFRLIKGYDVKARYSYHMERLETIQTLADELIYSYPLGSYEGKAQKLPYELESKFESRNLKKVAWDLVEIEQEVSETPENIRPDLAQELYFTTPVLSGSVSTFEHFFNCPYRYFLLSGLKIERPETYDINNQVMGNLIHKILEDGVKTHKKAYATVLSGHESEQLEPYFVALKALFKADSAKLDALKDRSVELLALTLKFLKDREEATEFEPFDVEFPFDEIKELDEEKSIHFRGRVDRIDINQNGFVVLDYKSSIKKLSEPKVLKGLQLQLPTYLWILEDVLKKQPYGAYYFSFGQGKVSIQALKHKTKEGIAVSEYSYPDEWLKGRRMNGWTLEPVLTLDFTGNHIVGVTAKESSLSLKDHYDSDKISAKMIELYTTMLKDLENGVIRKQNLAGSCTYCDFKNFCQYKGKYIKLPRIYKRDSILQKVKES